MIRDLIPKAYLAILTFAGLTVCGFSVLTLRTEMFDLEFFIASALAIFLTPYLRFQLPRTKIHFTVSETFIFYLMMVYGGGAAVLVGALEILFVSLIIRRQGIIKNNKTILFNVMTIVVATCLTSFTLSSVFDSQAVIAEGSVAVFGGMLFLTAIVQFLGNSILIALRESLGFSQPLKKFWEVWFKYCTSVLAMFLTTSLIAGLLIKSHDRFDAALFLLAVVISIVVYLTYSRYVNDIKEHAAKVEQAERLRAEQAERHIGELQQHIAEQDRIGQALRESKEKFRYAAFHDSLTDLPNRNSFMETLKFAFEKSRHNKKLKFAVLFLDINRFKTINDSLGHLAGDKLISRVARRLSEIVGDQDLVARFSGDEFAFIINDAKNVEQATQLAELIKEKIAEPFQINGEQVFTSFSIGIAMGGADYKAAEDILRDADIAMYDAKGKEKDYVVFDKNMHTRAVTRMQLETDLRNAIERREFVIYYQPIINLTSMKIFGFESLIRWNHPTRGLVPPNDFIPVCEQTGFILPLTIWVLRTSCRQMVEWQRKNPANDNLVVSVNISGKHFAQKDLVEQIKVVLTETGINPKCVKLELTESSVMENAANVITMMKQIRDLGVHLSIDDFGTGYSSLSYLNRFPINTLKVDRSFVSTMEDGSENGEIVRTVISLAKTLRLDVIAEGIETIHQLHQLRILGCEYGQGYLFSRPVPACEAEKLIEEKSLFENTVAEAVMTIPTVEVANLRSVELTIKH